MKNKIGWCNTTWNPVWGCRNHCSYCYARAIAKRFGGIRFIEEWKYRVEHNMDDVHFKLKNSLDLIEFKPTFLYSQFEKKFPKKPQRIFVGSMSEIEFWREDWMLKVLGRIEDNPQHTFQFLTKHPEVYRRYVFPKNCWLGVTITDNNYSFEYQRFMKNNPYNLHFICFEPLLESRYTISIDLEGINWIILGAESGNRKGKVLPGLDPVLKIFRYCLKNKIPIYVKDNLSRPDVPFDFCRKYKQFPNYK